MRYIRSFTAVPSTSSITGCVGHRPPFRKIARWLCGSIAALSCNGGAENAASLPSLEGANIEELMNVRVTTVSRGESTVGQSPAAVHVITQEDIRRLGATMIPELLRMVPGLAVARIDGNKWAVASRGFNNRFAKNLLVQVDGRTVYHPLTAGVFWETVDYPLADIDRIEVIRGPGASVWGANAVNGIINIITKSSKDTKGGHLSGGGGNVAQGFTDFRFGGQLGDDVTWRLYGKGYNQDEQFSLDGNPNDNWWRATGGLRIDWQATGRDTVTLDAGFTRTAAGAKDRFALKEGPPFSVAIPETETRDTAHVLARWSRQLDADSSWATQAYWDRFLLIGDSGYRNARWNTFDLDFQHQFPLGQRQKIVWSLGFRYIDAHLTNSNPVDAFSLDWLENDPHSQLLSAFVQDQIAVVPDRLTMMLGTKIEHNSFTGRELQPTGRLLWTPTKRQAAWAAVSRAVRTPSFTEDDVRLTLPNAHPALRPAARLVANRNLEPEVRAALATSARSQEAGVEGNSPQQLVLLAVLRGPARRRAIRLDRALGGPASRIQPDRAAGCLGHRRSLRHARRASGLAGEQEPRVFPRRPKPARQSPPGIRDEPLRAQPADGNPARRVWAGHLHMVANKTPGTRAMTLLSRFPRAATLAMACATLAMLPAKARAQVSEYQLKALFLARFPEFVTWPDKAFSGPGTPIVIGILGDDPFDGALDQAAKGKVISGRKIVVRRVSRVEDLKNCHIAFIANSERARLSEIVSGLGGSNTLVVGDSEQVARQGGAIGFKMVGTGVRFEINNGAARRAGLELSSRFLKLARGSGPP